MQVFYFLLSSLSLSESLPQHEKETSLPNNGIRNHLVWQTLTGSLANEYGMGWKSEQCSFFSHSMLIKCVLLVYLAMSGGRIPQTHKNPHHHHPPSSFHTHTNKWNNENDCTNCYLVKKTESHRISFIINTWASDFLSVFLLWNSASWFFLWSLASLFDILIEAKKQKRN